MEGSSAMTAATEGTSSLPIILAIVIVAGLGVVVVVWLVLTRRRRKGGGGQSVSVTEMSHTQVSSTSRSATPLYDFFISFRFGEAHAEALRTKADLEAAGKTVFISDVQSGGNLEEVICEALDKCKMVIVFGTATYGRSTTSFSTYHEINYTIDEKKPFYLIKMCDRWEETHVRMKFGQRTMYTLWMPGDPMPNDLIANILAKLDTIDEELEKEAAEVVLPTEENTLAPAVTESVVTDASTVAEVSLQIDTTDAAAEEAAAAKAAEEEAAAKAVEAASQAKATEEAAQAKATEEAAQAKAAEEAAQAKAAEEAAKAAEEAAQAKAAEEAAKAADEAAQAKAAEESAAAAAAEQAAAKAAEEAAAVAAAAQAAAKVAKETTAAKAAEVAAAKAAAVSSASPSRPRVAPPPGVPPMVPSVVHVAQAQATVEDFIFEENKPLGMGLVDAEGEVVVRQVRDGGMAQAQGVRPGSKVVAVNGAGVTSATDATARIAAGGRPLRLKIAQYK